MVLVHRLLFLLTRLGRESSCVDWRASSGRFGSVVEGVRDGGSLHGVCLLLQYVNALARKTMAEYGIPFIDTHASSLGL